MSESSLNILVIEDSEMDFRLVQRELSRSFSVAHIERVDTHGKLIRSLEGRNWSVVISDYNVPGLSIRDTLSALRKKGEIPAILLSGAIGEETTVEMLRAGFHDVVVKGNLPRLPLAIKRVLKERATQEREREAREAEQRALRARQEMLAIVSHDLRNPLAAIQLNAERLLGKARDSRDCFDEDELRQLRSILRSTVRMKILIADVLDNVRFETGSFVIHRARRSMASFITEVFEIFDGLCAEKSIRLLVQNHLERALAELDFERVFQVLSNLLSNAIKFTPPGGVIRLTVYAIENGVSFEVADSGSGMTIEECARVFEPYYQGKKSAHLGVGLGLKIAREIVEAHGGRIEVSSEPGQGAVFRVEIPTELSVLDGTDARSGVLAGRPVWLVDDDEDLREILASNLRDLELNVTELSSGEELVEAFRQAQSEPDLLIVDYRLGDMTGGEALEKIYSGKSPRCPVILLSAETNVSQLAVEHRASAYLTKPIRLNDLVIATRKLLLS